MVHVKNCEETTDCISRADVEQTVEDNILYYTHSDRPIDQDPDTECHMAIRVALRMLRKDLRKLPPVTPQQKTGHWIKPKGKVKPFGDDTVQCDMCGFFTDVDCYYNFCPNCGCMMVEEGEHDS